MGTIIAVTAAAGMGGTGLGGLAAYLFRRGTDRTVSVLLSFAAGAMLYVVFGEIMPESYLIYRSKLPAFAVMVGLALGMFMIFF